MKAKIIILSIVLSAAIWFAIGWAFEFIGWNDYGFVRIMMIVMVWYCSLEEVKIVKREEDENKNKQ